MMDVVVSVSFWSRSEVVGAETRPPNWKFVGGVVSRARDFEKGWELVRVVKEEEEEKEGCA